MTIMIMKAAPCLVHLSSSSLTAVSSPSEDVSSSSSTSSLNLNQDSLSLLQFIPSHEVFHHQNQRSIIRLSIIIRPDDDDAKPNMKRREKSKCIPALLFVFIAE